MAQLVHPASRYRPEVPVRVEAPVHPVNLHQAAEMVTEEVTATAEATATVERVVTTEVKGIAVGMGVPPEAETLAEAVAMVQEVTTAIPTAMGG